MVLLLIANPSFANAQTDPAQLAKAVQEIENLDAMRSGLASTLEGSTTEPTMETMKEVCKPVGMRAHAPDYLHALMALAKFKNDPELMGFWDSETIDGQQGTRYYRRINVESSCLACHGGKNARPQFVKDKYPQDLAFDFKVGDLRGMYSVFIPYLEAE